MTAIATCCPEVPRRRQWAREAAMRWAGSATKRTIHAFVEWLNSAAFAPPEPDASGSAHIDERQRQRDAEWRELAKTRCCPPPDVLKLAKGGTRG